MPTPSRSVTAREVLGVREFRGLLGAVGLSLIGDQVARIAVALLVFERTGSAFASAATYACSYLSWLVAGPVLAAVADRLARKRLMVTCDLLRAALVLLLLLPDVGLWVVFPVLLGMGVLSPPFDAAKSALLPEVLEGERYAVGSALHATLSQGAQVAGFLAAGAVVALVGTRGALLLDALSFLLSGLLVAVYVVDRPLPVRAAVPLLTDALAGIGIVVGDPVLRRLLGLGVLGALVMIVPEGLVVPVTAGLGGGPVAVGVLAAAVPAGFVAGSVLLLRLPAPRRVELMPYVVAGGAAALLLTPLAGSTTEVAAVWVLAGAGSSVGVVANAAYMTHAAAEVRGRAFGVASTVLMAAQGLVLLLAGLLAERVSARAVVALLAALVLAAVAPLAARAPGRPEVGR